MNVSQAAWGQPARHNPDEQVLAEGTARWTMGEDINTVASQPSRAALRGGCDLRGSEDNPPNGTHCV